MHGSSYFQSDCVKGGTRDKNILAACSTSCVPEYTTFTNTIHSTATVSSSGKVIADTLGAVSLGHLALLQESTRRLGPRVRRVSLLLEVHRDKSLQKWESGKVMCGGMKT